MLFRKLSVFLALALASASLSFSKGITIDDVLKTQKKWGDGIVRISKVHTEGGDYQQAALDHIMDLYDYEKGTVLFKPTLAAEIPFRYTVVGALSYFVGGNEKFPEDTGFAIKGWTNVRFENHEILTHKKKAIAMGHYYFADANGKETKVEYTLAFRKRGRNIKITVQDSSLPYSP